MELLLWRWSTLVQATSALLIAVFFVALQRSVDRPELRIWTRAWLANLAALAVTIGYWLGQPSTPFAFGATVAAYVLAKTAFVLLLADGATRFSRGAWPLRVDARMGAGIVAFALVCGFAIRSIDGLGIVQSLAIGLVFGACAAVLARRDGDASGWLAAGCALRATLAFTETAAYALHRTAGEASAPISLPTFLASHSSFDTGAEWVIALGCVLTLHAAIRRELTLSNAELRAARDDLGALLDRDELTGVLNRRSLPAMLREAQASGASVLFFDLDDFKRINDEHGHRAGDACLVRFARALREGFPAGDRVIRYAGDEFLVLAQETDPLHVDARVAAVRAAMRAGAPAGQAIDFSVGRAPLAAHGDPDAALHAADAAMYAAKAARGV